MADNVLKFEFLAADHFSPTSEKVSRKLDTMGERMGNVGKVAAFALGKVAVGGVAAFGFEMVKGIAAAASYQSLQLKTAAVIKSTGNVAHVSVAGLSEMAHKLQEMSGVEEGLILNSENVLTTFTNIRNQTGKNNDIYNQATARILDLSVAMGEDLQSATVQVGKALNDPIKGMTALQRVGVTFTATQKEQIKHLVNTGHLMSAQKIILGELSKEFGGAAKAAGSGFGGSLAKLKNVIDDTFRDMAVALLPTLTKVATWLADKLPGAIHFVGAAFSAFGNVLVMVGKGFWDFLHVFTIGGLTLHDLAVKALQVAVVIRGYLVAGIAILVHYWRGLLMPALRDAAAKIFPAIKSAIASVSAAFKGHQDVIQAFGKVFMFVLKAVGVALAILGVLIVKVVIPVVAQLLAMVLSVVGPIVNTLLSITSVLGHVVAGVASFAVNASHAIANVAQGIAGVLVNVVSGIASFGVNAGHAIANVAKTIVGAFTSAKDWLFRAGQAIVSGLITGVTTVWPHIVIAMKHTIDFFLNPFKPALTMLFRAGMWILTGLINGAQSVWHVVTSWIAKTISGIIGFYAPAVRWLVGAGANVLRGFINGAQSVWHVVTSWIADKISRIIGFYAPAVRWLVGAGINILRGFLSGLSSMATAVFNAVRNFISVRILTPWKKAGTWLLSAGANIISGLLTGIKNALGSIGSWVNDHIVQPIIGAVKSFFGISSPSTVMMGIGGHLISGLILGLLKHNPIKMIGRIFGGMPAALGALVHKGVETIAGLPQKALSALGTLGADALAKLGITFGNPTDVKGFPKGVSRWAGFVNQALQMEGMSPTLITKVLRQMTTESGGNPNAINLWDSNAKAGTPSKGLMQVIDPTFRAFHWPGTPWNIYDPMANIAAALNYARHRYGPNLNGLGEGHGYDQGGVAYGKGLFGKWVSDPERILSPRQTKWFERSMAMGARAGGHGGHGGVTVVLNAPNYVGSGNELLDQFNRFARQGRLDAIVRMATR